MQGSKNNLVVDNNDWPLIQLLYPANHKVLLLLMLSLKQADGMLSSHLSEKKMS